MSAGRVKIAKGAARALAPGYGHIEILFDGTWQFVDGDTGAVIVLNAVAGILPGGRLTLTTGTPITTSDVTGAGTLYYTPHLHSVAPVLTSGGYWAARGFSEISLSLTLTSGKNYDVFVYDNAGTLALALSAAWTNDSTRAEALARVNGYWVKDADNTRLWVGTLRASGTNTTEKSKSKCFLWNTYNQAEHELENKETTTSWTHSADNWRKTNNADLTKIEWVNGDVATVRLAFGSPCYAASGEVGAIAIGVDSTSTPRDQYGEVNGGSAGNGTMATVATHPTVAAGYHYAHGLERARAGTVDFYSYRASSGGSNVVSSTAITGIIRA